MKVRESMIEGRKRKTGSVEDIRDEKMNEKQEEMKNRMRKSYEG